MIIFNCSGGELRCSGRVISSCSTSDTRRVNLVTHAVISHEWGNDREELRPMTFLTAMEYLCHKWPRICSTCLNTSRSFPHSWLITACVTRLTRRVRTVEYNHRKCN
jgi:hypothetical protein